ncbi:MAG TPA: hypothetical protein DEH78_09565 [Solibacterales bacterium]|nr:hypothetical protein [Bryobacterales bacterium]
MLDLVRGHLARRETNFRLLVPTATLAEHLRNVLARDGFAFRPRLILTLARFVEPFAGKPQPPAALLELVLARVLASQRHAEFASVVETIGFVEALAAAVDEFSTAGAEADTLDAHLTGPYAKPFASVYRAVEAEMSALGFAFRGQRLRDAARQVRLDGIERLYLDGFVSFTALETAFLTSCPAQVTVTLPEWEGSAAARQALGGRVERCAAAAPNAALRVVAAPTLELEADEIARRILARRGTGLPFREMGVVVRQARQYVPALRSAFARFGIPARFYFSDPLSHHGVVRYLSALAGSGASGWPLESLAEALSHPASGLGGTSEGDWLNYRLREAMPGRGLAAARKAAESKGAALFRILDQFDKPLGTLRVAGEWATHLAQLPAAVSRRQPRDGRADEVALWRSRALALEGFVEAGHETARALGADTLLAFPDFWRQVRRVLDLTPLRTPDHRRDVVHVMDAWEARQWRLSQVFVCGMLEGQFPAYPAQEPLFPDAARVRLREAGLRLKTTLERQQEEEFLWTMARTRASGELVLSYPKFNAKGEETLPSFWLSALGVEPEAAIPVRPAAPRGRAAPRPPGIRDETLRPRLRERFVTWGPTAIESFLTCPYQFFARYALRLRELPPRPDERLDFLNQGNLVHATIAEWHQTRRPIGEIFEERFAAFCRDENVRQCFATEVERLEMLRNLEDFAGKPNLKTGAAVETEKAFEFDLAPEIRVKGRIDRLDLFSGGQAHLCDYKYSSTVNLSKRFSGDRLDRYVQGGLYVLALASQGYRVERFDYCALRGGVKWRGYAAAELADLTARSSRLTIQTVRQVLAGEFGLRPADSDACRTCDYPDACRVKAEPMLVRIAGGAE